MALNTEKLERKSTMNNTKVRKWIKNQMNRYIRRQPVSVDDIGYKTNRKPTHGWEY